MFREQKRVAKAIMSSQEEAFWRLYRPPVSDSVSACSVACVGVVGRGDGDLNFVMGYILFNVMCGRYTWGVLLEGTHTGGWRGGGGGGGGNGVLKYIVKGTYWSCSEEHHEMLTQRSLLCIASNTKRDMLSQQFVMHIVPPLVLGLVGRGRG